MGDSLGSGGLRKGLGNSGARKELSVASGLHTWEMRAAMTWRL